MKKLLKVISYCTLILLVSCASKKDFDLLQNDFTSYKYSMEQRQIALEKTVREFISNYNPQLHNILSANIELATQHAENIKQIDQEIQSLAKKMRAIIQESERGKNQVLENAQTSETKNVVNEFNKIKTKWQQTLSESYKLVIEAQRSTLQSQEIANDITERSKKIESKAQDIHEVSKSLTYTKEQIEEINNQIIKNKQSYWKLQNIIFDLQKNTNELQQSINTMDTKIKSIEMNVTKN